jgi:hypothetical protein
MFDEANENWHVYYVYVERAGKPKYVLPICRHLTQWYCLVISSDPSPFFERRPELQPCRVVIPAYHHGSFLKWDSHLYAETEPVPVKAFASRRPAGVVHLDTRAAIVAAVQDCPRLKPKTLRMLLAALATTGFPELVASEE